MAKKQNNKEYLFMWDEWVRIYCVPRVLNIFKPVGMNEKASLKTMSKLRTKVQNSKLQGWNSTLP